MKLLAIPVIIAGVALAADMNVSVVERPDITKPNTCYVGNRAPLEPSRFIKLPIGAVQPGGWLRKQIELQAAGFHGNLGEISEFLRKDGNSWIDSKRGNHGWEEVPYWLKGYANAAYLLTNQTQLAETKFWIEAAMKSSRPDGWFGPESNLTKIKGAPDLWPNMVMQFILQDYYEYCGDPRVINLLTNYFRFLTTIPEEKFLPGYWDKMRGGDLLASVYWTYNRTGGAWLLELAEKVHRRTARWDRGIINWHNVNVAQAFDEPAIYWLQSKSSNDLAAAYRNYNEIRDIYGQVPGGMYGADENARPGFVDPRQAVETCGMVEEMLSDEQLLGISGDPLWADRCEDVAFNSLPAALTPDMKAMRYLTAPNMPQSDKESKSGGIQNGGPMFHMDPHAHRCCQHNWGHGWPYYAENLWLAAPGNGLAALLYAESTIAAKAGKEGVLVKIAEQTKYPFDEMVTLSVAPEKPVSFPLYLRIPRWCTKPVIKVAGQTITTGKPGAYVVIERTWSKGDTVTISLPMTLSVRTWTKNHNSVSIDRGPLTFSLKIKERYERDGGTDKWPAWSIYPDSTWNYGLVLNADAAKSFKVVTRAYPANNMPFTHEGTPIELTAQAKVISGWTLNDRGLVNTLENSPVLATGQVDTVTLVPMGAARLRISAFPVIGEGSTARAWSEPPKKPAPAKAKELNK